jgi:hypothetical protein
MGAYEISIDAVNATAELVSKRLPSLGESWTVSGIGFFTIAPCSNCLRIESISLTVENYLQLKFKINHPFPKGNPANPPSAKNRLDLDIFDLAMVIVPQGATATNYAQTGADIYSGILVNNPGYTTELKNVVGDGAAMPYVLVKDDSISATATWNRFSMGTVNSFFDVFFDTNTMASLNFDAYLTMGYGASALGKSQRLTPTYFNPEFNRKQAWKVVVTPPEGSDTPVMGNTWDDNDTTTLYDVTVYVYDWQQGVTAIANPPVNRGDIAKASSVSKVSVEIPGMTGSLVESSTPTGGSGDPSDPLIYEIPIANELGLGVGKYLGLVKVSDERVPETTPTAIDYLIDAPDGVTLTNYAIPEFATYQTFVATVVLGAMPPVCKIITIPDPPIVDQGDSVSLDGRGSTCINPIVSYQWDLDYDGVTFDVDKTGATTTFSNCTPQTITVALRVTSSVMLSSICSVDVTVNEDIGLIDGWHSDSSISPSMALYLSAAGMDNTIVYGDNIIVAGNNTSSPWRVYVVCSQDQGTTWGSPIQVYSTGNTSTYVSTAMNTRSPMVYDKNTGYIYLVFHSNDGAAATVHTDIYVTRSTDDGATWATPVKLNTDPSNTASQQSASFAIDDSVSPAKLYVAYFDSTDPYPASTPQNAWVERSDTSNWDTSWSSVQIDDSAVGTFQPIVRVNPIDQSVNVAYADPMYFHNLGTGRILFDRSTDGGVTFGTDVLVFTLTGSYTLYGPMEPNMNFNSSGIPAIMWRDMDHNSTTPWQGYMRHSFIKANDISGSSWGTQIPLLQTNYAGYGQCLSGDLECLGIFWMAMFNQNIGTAGSIDKVFFTQSRDDGVTWDTPTQVNGGNYGTRSGSFEMDDCKNVRVIWPEGSTPYAYYDWGT